MDDNKTAIRVWETVIEEFGGLRSITTSVKGDILMISGDGDEIDAVHLRIRMRYIPNKCKLVQTLQDFEHGTKEIKYRFF